MPSSDEPISPAQKLKALRQIQFALDQIALPSARACGLTETELEVLANEDSIEVSFSKDEGPILDRCYISKILPGGFAVLAQAHTAPDETLQVSVLPAHKSNWKRIYDATRSGTWDLIKVAFGALLGWLLKN